MNYLDAIILGIVQGLTEFLPVSSSGHLVLAEHFLNVKSPGVTFEVIIHLGTLVSVLIFFRKRLLILARALYTTSMVAERRIVLFLIIGTIPAGLAGILLKDWFEKTFSNPIETSIELIITGLILLIPRFVRIGEKRISMSTAIIMGIGQAIAILPGISRSGTTIVTGMLAGVKPSEAAEFSFLLSIPAIGGAILLEGRQLLEIPRALLSPYAIATVVSFAFGLLSVYVVLAAVKRGKFDYFAYYCFAIGGLGLYHFL